MAYGAKKVGAGMNATMQRVYAKARAKGWTASSALALAKAEAMLAEYSEDVRVRIEPDEEPYDTGDMFTAEGWPEVSQAKRERAEKAFLEKLNRDGVWGYVVEYRIPGSERWEQSDSCWGFDDEEYCRESAIGAVPSAVVALREAQAKVCPMCKGKGRV